MSELYEVAKQIVDEATLGDDKAEFSRSLFVALVVAVVYEDIERERKDATAKTLDLEAIGQ